MSEIKSVEIGRSTIVSAFVKPGVFVDGGTWTSKSGKIVSLLNVDTISIYPETLADCGALLVAVQKMFDERATADRKAAESSAAAAAAVQEQDIGLRLVGSPNAVTAEEARDYMDVVTDAVEPKPKSITANSSDSFGTQVRPANGGDAA